MLDEKSFSEWLDEQEHRTEELEQDIEELELRSQHFVMRQIATLILCVLGGMFAGYLIALVAF